MHSHSAAGSRRLWSRPCRASPRGTHGFRFWAAPTSCPRSPTGSTLAHRSGRPSVEGGPLPLATRRHCRRRALARGSERQGVWQQIGVQRCPRERSTFVCERCLETFYDIKIDTLTRVCLVLSACFVSGWVCWMRGGACDMWDDGRGRHCVVSAVNVVLLLFSSRQYGCGHHVLRAPSVCMASGQRHVEPRASTQFV